MIRRDFILRQIQELAQVLARVLFLRVRGEYEAALSEIGQALRQIDSDPSTDVPSRDAEAWLDLCRRQESVTGPLMVVVGDLLREQAAALEERGCRTEAASSRDSALALHLESVLSGATPVTQERIDQIESDLRFHPIETMSLATLSRLFAYLDQRGCWAAAEDVLFDWLPREGEAARTAGRLFYERLGRMSEQELAAGAFTSAEVAQGFIDLKRFELGH